MESLKLVAQEASGSKHLHITNFLDSSIFELDNGQIGCVINFQGVVFDTAHAEELNQFKFLKHSVIAGLNESFSLYEYTVRQRLGMKLKGQFPDAFTAAVDRAYQGKFDQKHFYQNLLYLVLLYRGPGQEKLAFFERLNPEKIKLIRREYRDNALGHIRRETRQIMSILKNFGPKLLGEQDEQLGYSELMSFLGMLVNGLAKTYFAFPKIMPLPVGLGFGSGLGSGLGSGFASGFASGSNSGRNLRGNPRENPKENLAVSGDFKNFFGTLPQGSVSQYLLTHRLFFGRVIEFQAPDGQVRFGAVLSIKSYSTETVSSMLDSLLHLDAEFLLTNTFVIEDTGTALKKIGRHRVKMRNTKDLARSQISELGECQDQVASGQVKMGYHHHSLMLLADTQEALKAALHHATTCYSEASFGVISETLGLEAAFWAQFPGNQAYIFRAALVTSQNYVDFCPLHNYRTGYSHQNHLGEAVSLLETPSRTPMFFNFHAKGSGKANDLTPGHTTIIGGNGSGKSVFMGFMDSQMSRYGGRSYFFDRDRGLEIYIRATGGSYWIISPDHPEESCFNPFALDDTPNNRSFLKTWMKHLVRREDEQDLDPKIELMLSECVDYAFEALRPEHRYLSMVCRILPIDFPRWDRLRQWLRKSGRYSDGEYAYLFDNITDNFKNYSSNQNNSDNSDSSDSLEFKKADETASGFCFNRFKMGFDFTELLAQPNAILTAVCMYLMHQIKACLDGSRVSIFFDEGWQILDNAYWQNRLKQDLPTFRKMNAHLILATQSPESILGSALSAQFLDNSATHIFFCNPKANYEKHYRHFHVTPAEFDFLSKVPQELRWFLYKQSQESAICKLNLSGMDAFLAVYSGNKSTVQLLEKLRAEVGDDPKIWLPLFCQSVLGKKWKEEKEAFKNNFLGGL